MEHIREVAVQTANSCALCGSEAGVTMRAFRKTYTPGWVWLLLLIGPIVVLIVGAMVSTTHPLAAPFCSRCALRHKYRGVVFWGAGISAVLMFFAGAAIGIEMGSASPFLICAFMAVLIAVAGDRYAQSTLPRFTTFNATNVVIDDARRGPIVLVAPPPLHQLPSMLRL